MFDIGSERITNTLPWIRTGLFHSGFLTRCNRVSLRLTPNEHALKRVLVSRGIQSPRLFGVKRLLHIQRRGKDGSRTKGEKPK